MSGFPLHRRSSSWGKSVGWICWRVRLPRQSWQTPFFFTIQAGIGEHRRYGARQIGLHLAGWLICRFPCPLNGGIWGRASHR